MKRGVTRLLLPLLAIACGGDADPGGDDPGGDEWSILVAADWSVPRGREMFVCALATLPVDMNIAAWRTLAPPGTHHSLLTVTEPVASDGTFECDPGTLSDAMVFASGIGTNDLIFPDGVAMRIPAGKQVLLNLHLVNTTEATLHGRSAVVVRSAAADAIEAEMVFAGTVDIEIAPGAEHDASGSCVFEEDATVFDLWPHMHQLGTHMSIVHHSIAGSTTLLDAPYDVDEQRHYPVAPLAVRRGDTIGVTCSWKNNSDATVRYGDTSADEMCFAGLYRYPAANSGLYCDASP